MMISLRMCITSIVSIIRSFSGESFDKALFVKLVGENVELSIGIGCDGTEPVISVGVQVLDLLHDGDGDHDVLHAVGPLEKVDLLQDDVRVDDGVVPATRGLAQAGLAGKLSQRPAEFARFDATGDVVAKIPLLDDLLHRVPARLAVELGLRSNCDRSTSAATIVFFSCVKYHFPPYTHTLALSLSVMFLFFVVVFVFRNLSVFFF